MNNIRFDQSKYRWWDFGFGTFRRNSIILTGYALWAIADSYRNGTEFGSIMVISHEEIHATLRKIGETKADDFLDFILTSALTPIVAKGFEDSVCGLTIQKGKLLVPKTI